RASLVLDRLQDLDIRRLDDWRRPVHAGAVVARTVAHGPGGVVVRVGIDAPADDGGRIDWRVVRIRRNGGGCGGLVALGHMSSPYAALGIRTGLMQPSSLDENR